MEPVNSPNQFVAAHHQRYIDPVDHVLRSLGFGPQLELCGSEFRDRVVHALSTPEPVDAWPESRVYPLRSTYPAVLRRVEKPIDHAWLEAVIPELIASQVNLFAERLEFGKALTAPALARLNASIEHLDTEFGFTNEDTNRVRAWLATHRDKWRSDASGEFGAIRGSLPRGSGPEVLHEIATAATCPPELVERAFTEFFDSRAGLFTIEAFDRQPKRFLIDPIGIEALLALARRLNISLAAPTDRIALELPAKSKGMLGYIEAISCLPDLPRALSIRPPNSFRARLTEEAARRIEWVAFDGYGFSLRIAPIPISAPYILSLRRDVDRVLSVAEMDQHLAWQAQAGIQSTWFFKAETYRRELAHQAIAAGDEIGWHICHTDNGDDGFLDQLRRDFPGRIAGGTHHGGQDSSYWQGRATVDQMAAFGLRYGERLCDWMPHPEIDRRTGIALLHLPLKIESRPEWVASQEALIRDFRGHMVIENHPDLFAAELADQLTTRLAEGATMRRVGDHVATVRTAYYAKGQGKRERDSHWIRIIAAGGCSLSISSPAEAPFTVTTNAPIPRRISEDEYAMRNAFDLSGTGGLDFMLAAGPR